MRFRPLNPAFLTFSRFQTTSTSDGAVKKRGRPPKKGGTKAQPKAAAPAQNGAAPKRGRGRPPKQQSKAEAAAENSSLSRSTPTSSGGAGSGSNAAAIESSSGAEE